MLKFLHEVLPKKQPIYTGRLSASCFVTFNNAVKMSELNIYFLDVCSSETLD